MSVFNVRKSFKNGTGLYFEVVCLLEELLE